MKKSDKAADYKEHKDRKDSGSGRIRTGLLLLGSAVFGGIALVFWNRRTLTKMQNPPEEDSSKIPHLEDDAIY